jgi:uncharacterized protein YbjT (DUF2867 family)
MPQHRATTVAVTGATGFVGRHVCRALAASGHAVRALVRDRRKASANLTQERTEWIIGDALESPGVDELCAGADAVVHCIGIRREVRPHVTFDRMHPDATRRLIDAARNAGVRRFVHISALGTRPHAPSDYHRSKFESETLVRSSGLDWTILRPSLIHGPDGEFIQMIKGWVLGREAPWFFMPYFARIEAPPSGAGGLPLPRLVSAKVQPVFVGDVAAAVVAALASDDAIGEVYPLAGSETLDWPTLLAIVRDEMPLTERGKRALPLPGVVGVAMARAAEAVGLGALLPFGPSEPVMATEDNTCSTDKARRHLGLRPSAFLPTIREYAASI